MPYEDCATCSKPYLAVRAKEGEFHCSPCVGKVGRDQLPKTARTSCVHNDGTCHSAQTNFAMTGPRCAAYKQFRPMSGRLDIARFVYQQTGVPQEVNAACETLYNDPRLRTAWAARQAEAVSASRGEDGSVQQANQAGRSPYHDDALPTALADEPSQGSARQCHGALLYPQFADYQQTRLDHSTQNQPRSSLDSQGPPRAHLHPPYGHLPEPWLHVTRPPSVVQVSGPPTLPQSCFPNAQQVRTTSNHSGPTLPHLGAALAAQNEWPFLQE